MKMTDKGNLKAANLQGADLSGTEIKLPGKLGGPNNMKNQEDLDLTATLTKSDKIVLVGAILLFIGAAAGMYKSHVESSHNIAISQEELDKNLEKLKELEGDK